MVSVLPLLCVPLLLGTYDTIAWLKFLNTSSALRNGMYSTHPEIYNSVPILSSPQSCSNTVFDDDSMAFSFQYCKYVIDSSLTMNSIVSWLDSTALDLYCTEWYQIGTVNRCLVKTVTVQYGIKIFNRYWIDIVNANMDHLISWIPHGNNKTTLVCAFSSLPCNSKPASIARVIF